MPWYSSHTPCDCAIISQMCWFVQTFVTCIHRLDVRLFTRCKMDCTERWVTVCGWCDTTTSVWLLCADSHLLSLSFWLLCADSHLLSLSFTAYFEKDVNWNVIIKVERKATDLRVNVKAQGYAISCQLTCEDTAVGDKQLMSATVINDIILGRVQFCHVYLPPCITFSSTCCLPVIYLLSLCHLPVIHQSFTCHLPVIYLSSSYHLCFVYLFSVIYLSSFCHLPISYVSSTCCLLVIYLLPMCHLTVIYLSSTCCLPVIYLFSVCHLPVGVESRFFCLLHTLKNLKIRK